MNILVVIILIRVNCWFLLVVIVAGSSYGWLLWLLYLCCCDDYHRLEKNIGILNPWLFFLWDGSNDDKRLKKGSCSSNRNIDQGIVC